MWFETQSQVNQNRQFEHRQIFLAMVQIESSHPIDSEPELSYPVKMNTQVKLQKEVISTQKQPSFKKMVQPQFEKS